MSPASSVITGTSYELEHIHIRTHPGAQTASYKMIAALSLWINRPEP
jgi:hypothetical protein